MGRRSKRSVATISGRVARARAAKGLSASELSRRAGLARGHVALIESAADAGITAKTATALASALGVSLSWLLTGEGDGPAAPTKAPRSERRSRAAAPEAASGTDG